MKVIIIYCLVFFSFLIQASDNNSDFKCTVKQAQHVAENGKLDEVKSWDVFLEKNFMVDRQTGIIVGQQFKNNIASIKPLVYDHFVNGYSVIAATNTQVVRYLQITTIDDSPKKVFIYIMNNVVLSGVCVSF
ncbi:hypothetical protein Q4530_15040 [Colwellia sp. 1_MG-2023]|uniref:hypothetical protein n=1 Tax=unclassified Colwellia TaxID=196834 RepID=UPI001C095B4D|nr:MULTISPECIES: hypothetical protein [unclassified Colwellia]MBU2923364.1 hypothetical protein [Colwellia sp. C2M11]MDO6653724.1 hypothetical protein [Colwellia sp. 3_MG-2023]MDO6666646.1 hypothetical protein [Colwellia sp. 2_MG-2023]MDO6691089.1 hypothetical protein [Colwellia sp. 1_MG-2023]